MDTFWQGYLIGVGNVLLLLLIHWGMTRAERQPETTEQALEDMQHKVDEKLEQTKKRKHRSMWD